MIKLIIITIVVILLTIGLVWLIDKFIPAKLKPVLNIALWGLIAFLGYQTFMSVYNPILFKQTKEKRYAKVITNLIDIRDSQLAYREIKGKYTNNFDSLVNFIETAQYAIIQRRDTTVLNVEKTKLYGGVEFFDEKVLIDTLAFVPVRDSLFKSSTRYKTMMNVPFAKQGTKYTMNAGEVGDDADSKIPVFEAFILKDVILHDQERDYVIQENEVISVDGVNGNAIRVGSMEEVKVNGNWPKLYDTKK